MLCYCMIFKAELLNYQKKYLPSKCFYENRHYPSSDLFHEQYLQSYAAGWLLQKEKLLY